MPSMKELGKVPQGDLYVFYVVDTSESMIGTMIAHLHRLIEETLIALKEVARKNADANVKIAVMEFDSNVRWMSNSPKSVENLILQDLEAGGLTQVGEALAELDSKLSRYAFLSSMTDTGAYIPIIIFMSAGPSTDDYKKELDKIYRNNKWFRRATKIGFAMGDNADLKMIAEVVGNSEAVIKTDDLDTFAKLIRFASVTASMLASQSQTSNTAVDGASIVDEVVRGNKMPDDIIVGGDVGGYDPEPEEWPGDDDDFSSGGDIDDGWDDDEW